MEKQEVESPAAWRPEPGKTAWTMMGNTCQEVEVTGKSEQDFAGLNNVMIRVPNFGERGTMEDLLFPTAEAALASIKVYDLNGVEVPRQQPVFEAGAAEKLLLSWMDVFDTIVQTFKDYRTGKIKTDEFDAYIDSSIATSDRLHSKALAIHDFMVRAGEKPLKEGRTEGGC